MLHFFTPNIFISNKLFHKTRRKLFFIITQVSETASEKKCMEGDSYIIACHALTSKTIVKDSHSLTRERLSRSFLHY